MSLSGGGGVLRARLLAPDDGHPNGHENSRLKSQLCLPMIGAERYMGNGTARRSGSNNNKWPLKASRALSRWTASSLGAAATAPRRPVRQQQ
jgi:hypothetical protein